MESVVSWLVASFRLIFTSLLNFPWWFVLGTVGLLVFRKFVDLVVNIIRRGLR